jgi:hypothetical protein
MMRSVVLAYFLLAPVLACAAMPAAKQPVDYVSPNIGSIGQMLGPTLPFVQYPYACRGSLRT